MAAIEIKWDGLAKVTGVSLAFGVGLAVVFTLGVLGLSRVEAARDSADGSPARTTGYVQAGACFAACAAAVLYGLYLLIPQFH